MDVEVDAEEEQWPKRHGENGRQELGDGVDRIQIVLARRQHDSDDDVEADEEAPREKHAL